MAARITGKQRASQIPLNYYRTRDRLGWWRLVLVIAVPLLAVAWWAASYAAPDRGASLYSHGPLAAVHATWDHQCDACHVPFRPINDRTIAAGLGGMLGPAASCESCHRGPIHHESQAPDNLACASCHHDHNGRDFGLKRSPDSDCTQCHADLGQHLKADAGPLFTQAQAIHRFDQDHPPFRLPAKDPGALKFNHALHLAEGLREGFTYSRIDAADLDRYLAARPGSTLDAKVQLDCASCHQLERGDSGAKTWDGQAILNVPAAASGTYMAPVSYEVNCRGCHSLAIEPPGDQGEGLAIRHGLRPAEISQLLWGYYSSKPADKAAAPKPTSAMPGRRPLADRVPPGAADADAKAAEKVRNDAEFLFRRDKVAQADAILFGGRQTCAECHGFEPAKGEPFEIAMTPPKVPRVWMEHAKFDHVAHRAVNCAECHNSAEKSETSADVLMPAIETCQKCHAPKSSSGGASLGGARFDCVECHRYHNGKEPLKGVGAMARDAAAERDIQRFLRGAPESKSTGP